MADNQWEVADDSKFKPVSTPAAGAVAAGAGGSQWEIADDSKHKPQTGLTEQTSPEDMLGSTTGFESAPTSPNVASDFLSGVAKGAGQTVNTVSKILNKIPGVGETLAPQQGIAAAQKLETPQNAAEKVGVGAEGIAEFLAGDEAFAALGAAQKLGIATKIAEYAKTSPRLAAVLTHGIQAVRQGGVAGGQSLLHGADISDALKTAGMATLAGAGVGAAAEGAGAAYQNVAKKLSPKYLQEPLQNALHETLEGTAKASNIGGPAPEMNYVTDESGKLGNMQHRVSTVNPQTGEDVGMLEAQNTRPDTVTVRSNQVPDPANRGRGYGQAQIRKLLAETKSSGKNFVQSDISTTPDAQRAWKALEADHPDAITHKDFAPKVAEGQPEPLGKKTQWTVDLKKYTPPADDPLNPSALKRPESIRNAASDMGDKVLAESKADYQALDEATGGKFQRFREKLDAGRKALRNAITTEDEAPIYKKIKETEDEMNDAFDEARKKGVPPELIDRADANFRKSQALYDLDNAVKKSTSGAHPGMSHPDLLADSPETLDPKAFHKRVNALYDSGRLHDALGEEGANKLFDKSLEHSAAYDKIMRNRKIALGIGVGAGSALGYGALSHHGGAAAGAQ